MSMKHFATITLTIAMLGLSGTTEAQDRPDNNRVVPGQQNARGQQQQDWSKMQGKTVTEALAMKLMKANKAEIELAQMAQQKVKREDIQQLTTTVINDHKKLNEKLQQMVGSDSSQQGRSDRRQTAIPNRQTPVSTPGQEEQRGRNVNGIGANENKTVPPQLLAIGNQACDNALEMTKEMLSNYQDQDFAMAFLGQQVVTHTMALAELKAIQSTGPEELSSFTNEAIDTIEQHLEKTKQLAKKYEDDRRTKTNQ